MRSHIAELLKVGAIAVRSEGKPKFYGKGPNSYLFAKRSSYDTPYEKPAKCRFHWVSAKCEILTGKCPDLNAIEWTKVWHPRKDIAQTYRLLKLTDPEATVRVYDEGSLEIWIPDTFVDFDPDALREAAKTLEQRIYQAVKYLSSKLQFGLGIPILTRVPHIAQEITNLKGKKLPGRIDIDESTWFDQSLSENTELESNDLEDQILRATAHRDLPKLMRLVSESIKESKLTQKSNDEMIAFLLEANTDTNKRHNELIKKLEEVIQLNNKNDYKPQEAGDDRKGYL